MTAGIFALIGVVIGGLIAAGTGYWLERKREDREVQTAARRAFIDLYACSFGIREAVKQGRFVEVNEIARRLGRYHQHDSTFAVHLRIGDYLVLSHTVRRLWLAVEQGEARRTPTLTDDVRRELESLRDDADEAGDILLNVAIRGPEHMWGQRQLRRVHGWVMHKSDEKGKSKILELVQDLIRLPPRPQPASRDDDGTRTDGVLPPDGPPSSAADRACLAVTRKLLKRSYHTLRELGEEAPQRA